MPGKLLHTLLTPVGKGQELFIKKWEVDKFNDTSSTKT